MLQPVEQNIAGGAARRVTLGPKRPQPTGRPSISTTAASVSRRRQSVVPNTKPPPTPGRRASVQPNKQAPPRRTSEWRGPGAGGPPDSRTLKTKQQTDAIQSLISYLASHDYKKFYTVEELRSPATKDVKDIFEFLGRQVIPSFTVDKLEQIPTLLKYLGYPQNIAKSALNSAGAPHTWPLLLAALSWMRELLEYEEACFPSPDTYWEGDKEFVLLIKSYQLFMEEASEDVIAEHNAIQEEEARSELNAAVQSLSDKQKRKKQLINELKQVRSSEDRPDKLKAELATIEKDTLKLKDLLGKYEETIATLDKNWELLEKDLDARMAEAKKLREEEMCLASQLETQELKPLDRDRMNRERETLTVQLTMLRTKKSALIDRPGKKMWNCRSSWIHYLLS